jgi:hypothetical protein
MIRLLGQGCDDACHPNDSFKYKDNQVCEGCHDLDIRIMELEKLIKIDQSHQPPA